MNNKKLYITLLASFSLLLSFGQEKQYTGNPDASFFVARDYAFNGNLTSARDTLKHILTKYPDYVDVRNLLANTYSWEGKHDEARKHFNRITSVERKNKEVWIAAIKNEIYAENNQIAVGLANKALMYLKEDADIDALRTKIMAKLNNAEEDIAAEDLALKDSTEVKVYKNKIGVTNSFEVFDKVYDPMTSVSLDYKIETKAGSIIPRINYNNRFETHGVQYELDFYPKFSKTFYAYLNYGYSDATIFPDHRVGVELYANLPKAKEVSLGMRYLDFEDSSATILTGSLGLYKGNYYFSLRPYVSPREDGTISFSGSLLARKYLKDAENYIGFNAAMGYAPELKQLSNNNILLSESVLYIESQRLLMEYQFTGKQNPNIYNVNLGVTRQELVFDSGNFVWSMTAGISYQVKF